METDRQVVHVIWQEDDGRIRLSPMIFQDGLYVGWNEIVTLSSAFREASQGDGEFLVGEEPLLLDVRATDDGTALTITLADPATSRVGTLRAEVLPLLMDLFGDALHQEILDSADLFDPDTPSSLAEGIGVQIIHIGSRLNLDPDVSGFLSERVSGWLQTSGGEFGWDLLALADASRTTALDLGRAVYGVTVPNGAGDGESVVLDIGDFLDSGGHRDELARLLRLRISADYVLPEDAEANLRTATSGDGSVVAMSWLNDEGTELVWRLNRGDGWSEIRTLELSESLSSEEGLRLIEESIR